MSKIHLWMIYRYNSIIWTILIFIIIYANIRKREIFWNKKFYWIKRFLIFGMKMRNLIKLIFCIKKREMLRKRMQEEDMVNK